ncbi:hypothetical protein GEMRC1_003770 [Eukaryota sp. GEM-RC1]
MPSSRSANTLRQQLRLLECYAPKLSNSTPFTLPSPPPASSTFVPNKNTLKSSRKTSRIRDSWNTLTDTTLSNNTTILSPPHVSGPTPNPFSSLKVPKLHLPMDSLDTISEVSSLSANSSHFNSCCNSAVQKVFTELTTLFSEILHNQQSQLATQKTTTSRAFFDAINQIEKDLSIITMP